MIYFTAVVVVENRLTDSDFASEGTDFENLNPFISSLKSSLFAVNGWCGLKPFKKRFAKKMTTQYSLNGWCGLTVMICGCGPLERGSTPRAGLLPFSLLKKEKSVSFRIQKNSKFFETVVSKCCPTKVWRKKQNGNISVAKLLKEKKYLRDKGINTSLGNYNSGALLGQSSGGRLLLRLEVMLGRLYGGAPIADSGSGLVHHFH